MEFKFRDFDLNTQTMRYFDIDKYDRQEHDCYGNMMQFINSKDKDGKDVYCGDILEAPSGNIFEVKWDYRSLRWNMFDKKGNEFLMNMPILKVIGNIHENPNLIKP